MIDPKTIYLTGEAAKFHKPGKIEHVFSSLLQIQMIK